MDNSTASTAPIPGGLTGGKITTAVSQLPEARAAVQDIWQQLDAGDAACVVFFCSPHYALPEMTSALAEFFGDIPLMGCTTAGEISERGMTSSSITAFCLPAGYFVVEIIRLNKLAAFSAQQAFDAVRRKVELLEQEAIAPGRGNSFALSLLDGMSIREELVLTAINDALDGIPLLGGSAGDDLNFGDTYVYFDGQFHNNAAALILVNTICPFEAISSHHFSGSSEKLVVTDADPTRRIAREINAEPAALEYCRSMGLSLDELNSHAFALYPLAVHVGDNLYIRSVQQVNDDLSLTFFCAIDTGIVLTKVHDEGMVEHFAALMMDVTDRIGPTQLVIGYDCIHRCIEAETKSLKERLSELYREHHVLGFNTYGEQCNGLHVNHSFTGVAIGVAEPGFHA